MTASHALIYAGTELPPPYSALFERRQQTYWKDKNKGVIWARGTEDQKRGAIHFHALIGDVPDFMNLVKYRNLWYAKGGICQILPYRKENGAEYYMSKSTYAWKRGEIDLSDTLKKEVGGTRISGKAYHQEFIRRYMEDRLRVPLSFFSWD